MSHIASIVAYLWANKTAFLLLIASVISAASFFIKALEALVAFLLVLFPQLKGVDGTLKSVAAWLDALSKSSWLNTMALSPKSALKAVVALVAVGVLSMGTPARAQVLVSSGPTVPLMEVRPGNPHPISLAAGAGYQLSFTLPQVQKVIGGKSWDIVDLNLMAFGSAVSNTSGQTFGALSAAAGFSFLSSLFFIGGGRDVVTAPGLTPGWFGLFALSFNFALAPEVPSTFDGSSWHLPRGNTVYLLGGS